MCDNRWMNRYPITVLACAAAALALSACAASGGAKDAAAAMTSSSTSSSSSSSSTTTSPATSSSTSSAPPAPAAPAHRDARASDYKITLKTKSKECFGSAGCNITAEIRLAWKGPDNARPSDEDTYDITYSLTGGDSGPIVGTITTTGTRYDAPEELVSTNPNPHLRVKITEIEKTS